MLGILSGLNWAMAALYAGVLIFIGVMFGAQMPYEMFALIGMMLMLMALPSAYLGYAIEQGRGRGLQTIYAVLALFNFPIGTAYGAFALWVCWGAEAELFDQGGVDATQPRRDSRVVEVDAPAFEENEAEAEAEATAPRAETPYAIARKLKDRGLKAGDIQEQLHGEGLTGEEIETLMNSLGLKYSRVKQRQLEELG
jgi:hypothetical protein